jgi:hypothetical protein
MMAYLICEPDMVGTFGLLNLLGGAVFLVFEQEDNCVDWFGQNGKSIIVNTKDLVNSEIANADVFENGREEGLKHISCTNTIRCKVETNRFRLNLTPARP